MKTFFQDLQKQPVATRILFGIMGLFVIFMISLMIVKIISATQEQALISVSASVPDSAVTADTLIDRKPLVIEPRPATYALFMRKMQEEHQTVIEQSMAFNKEYEVGIRAAEARRDQDLMYEVVSTYYERDIRIHQQLIHIADQVKATETDSIWGASYGAPQEQLIKEIEEQATALVEVLALAEEVMQQYEKYKVQEAKVKELEARIQESELK